ncbi:hypothetical protein [Kribbella solani]|uniref:SurA-like protein n=1 Tax=Kribbella solani TaxID=236067 RepID=A0A841DZE9_9ACTN|nr:hypothetical protein [Kribbella solani]MBB5983351.1 hypothetical protein [Kribbella solani]MDX2971403.1 hypothetical protein [Kribbella solani]
MSRGRKLGALGAAVATVLLAGGCAAGTHPGAAAMVGGTEISIGDVDKTAQAVTAALGKKYDTASALSDMVSNVLVEKVQQQKSITVTPAETAVAAKAVVGGDQQTYEKFQADSVARDFLNQVGTAAIVTAKLGGGTVEDLQNQAKLQQGSVALRDAMKNVDVTIAPRFGQWTDGRIDSAVSGSLSVLSPQTAAQQKAAQQQQQPQQGQG